MYDTHMLIQVMREITSVKRGKPVICECFFHAVFSGDSPKRGANVFSEGVNKREEQTQWSHVIYLTKILRILF